MTMLPEDYKDKQDTLERASEVVDTEPKEVLVPPDYKPREDEPYMSPLMKAYFRKRLLAWRQDIIEGSRDTISHMQAESVHQPDMNDRASVELDTSLELRTRDRERKLLNKISAAIARIDTDDYGYCGETEEKIGVRRLEARPIATLCIEAQERHEVRERTERDPD